MGLLRDRWCTEWFRGKNGSTFEIAKIDADITAPIDTSKSIFTQRMAAVESKRRDAF